MPGGEFTCVFFRLFLSFLCSSPSFSSPPLSNLPVWKGLEGGFEGLRVLKGHPAWLPGGSWAVARAVDHPFLAHPQRGSLFGVASAFDTLELVFLGGRSGWSRARGKATRSPLCFLRWQRIGGRGEG